MIVAHILMLIFITTVFCSFVKMLIDDFSFDHTKLSFEPISDKPFLKYNVKGKFFQFNGDITDEAEEMIADLDEKYFVNEINLNQLLKKVS